MAFPSLTVSEFKTFEDLCIQFSDLSIQDKPNLVPKILAASAQHTLPGTQVIPALDAFYATLIPQPYKRLTFPAPQPMIPNHWVLRAPLWFRNGSISGPCKTFTCFSKLPAEIRLRIWKYAFPGPRLVLDGSYLAMRHTQQNRPPQNQPHQAQPRPIMTFQPQFCGRDYLNIPMTLHICAESRSETLRHYTPIGRYRYIDFTIDTLWIPTTNFERLDRAFPVHTAVPWIQSIMLEEYRCPHHRLRLHINSRAEVSFATLWWQNTRIMAKFPNLRELILKTRRETVKTSPELGIWDYTADEDKHTNFRSYMERNEHLERFGIDWSSSYAMRFRAQQLQDQRPLGGFQGVQLKIINGESFKVEHTTESVPIRMGGT